MHYCTLYYALATLLGGVIIATLERTLPPRLRTMERGGLESMSEGKFAWILGGVAGVLFAGATGLTVLARSPYTLQVRVLDSSGVLPGVWVSLSDHDVLSTNAQGQVQFKGRRYEFESALLTVTDPNLERPHLSRSLRTAVSWNPFQRESVIEVQLPRVDVTVGAGEQASLGSPGAMDLPLEAGGEALSVAGTYPLAPTQILEEELVDTAELHSVHLQTARALQNAEPGQGRIVCSVSGFSVSFCQQMHLQARPPLISLHAPVRGTNAIEKSLQLSEIPLEEPQPVVAHSGALEKGVIENASSKTLPSTFVNAAVKIEVALDGKPLANAAVYLSRLKDSRVRELGRTTAEGLLTVKMKPEFWGESVTVFHDCCAPRTFPAKLTRVAGEEKLKIDVQPGDGWGVLVEQEAYGYLRKAGPFDVLSAQGTLSVSGQDGFALYNASKTPDLLPTRVQARNARPFEFFLKASDLQDHKTKPISFRIAPDEPYLPSIAVLEKVDGRNFQGLLKSSALRRWRRDFMARLMKQSSFRPQVTAESEARIAAAGESATDLIANGWSQTLLAGEWDFLLLVEYNEATSAVRVLGKKSEGRPFYESEVRLSKDATLVPESVARKTFEDFVEGIPFEAHVVNQAGNLIDLSFSNLRSFGLKDDSPIALYQQQASPDGAGGSELAALAVVVGGEEGTRVKARITHWNNRARKTEVLPDVVRAVKVTRDFYRSEAAKGAMAKARTKSTGRAL